MQQPSRDDLERWDRQHVWHAFTQMAAYEPLLLERGQGSKLFDIDGRELLDGVSSLWCNVHGHRHPHIDAAIRDQLDRVAHTTLLGASNSSTIRLARRLVELTPAGLEHVFFSSDGASAVEVAIKLALQYWRQCPRPQPAKICYVALADAYHGDTIGGVSVGGVERFHAMFEPLLFEVLRLPRPGLYRLPPSVTAATACEHYLAQAEALLAEHHARIAAFVIEPLVQAAAGIVTHPPGYLRGLRELTRRHDVLLIADEVAVGFGRTGTLFACQQEEVSPDLLCLGKGLTGGYLPMAATLASDEIYRAFLAPYEQSRQFFHGHTYSGNPLAAAAALASLEVFEQDAVLERLPAKIACLAQHLARISQHSHVGDVRQCGLMAGIELVRDRQTQEPYPWAEGRGLRACRVALEHGVLLRPLGNVLVVMPPLAVSLEELDQIMLSVERGIEAATEART
ncbi:MAG TPA: adenosylmethionine--8-amino-7-oxononanoate transaminase [Pirellulales bacterium]